AIERSSDGENYEEMVSAVSAVLAAECLRTTIQNVEERPFCSPCNQTFVDTGTNDRKSG
ncbi:hypothetical protein KI387_024428, partial [Taxus chinensis]